MEPRKISPTAYLKLFKETDKKNPSLSKVKSEKASKSISEVAKSAHENAKNLPGLVLPIITKLGIDLLCEPKATGDYNFSLKPLGLPIAVGGIILDTLKAPFFAVAASEEAVRAGITKVASLIFENEPLEAEIDRIFKSFLIRMRETASLLVSLGLADKDVLENKLKSGDIEDLVGLTLLNTAYCSRDVHIGLFLASNKLLERRDCPKHGLAVYDKISDLRGTIYDALNLRSRRSFEKDDERQIEDARRACQWIELIVKGNPVSIADKPDSTIREVNLVNQVISLVNDLKQRGLTVLPEGPEEISKHIPRSGR